MPEDPTATADAPTPHHASFGELDRGVLYEILRLRSAVFVVEQNCAYLDLDRRDLEPDARHWWIEAGGAVVASLRTLAEADGSARIGRVVTDASARGQGHAAALVRAALVELPRPVVIDAQAHLARWYRSLGFSIVGDLFVEDGIDHLPMRLG